MLTRSARINLIWLLAALTGVGLFMVGPLLQDQAYHNFADKRALAGISNFADVISNVPFLVIGLLGMFWSGKAAATPRRRRYWRTLFFGVTLISLGSAYYHLNPNDSTLLWDRLPMTIAFMTLLTLVVDERIGASAASRIFPIAISLGLASVLLWRFGSGDLRLYGFVQFFPVLAIFSMLLLFPGPPRVIHLHVGAMTSYGLAKVLESLDQRVLDNLGFVSGHSLKHLAAALALWFLYRLMRAEQAGK